MKMFTNLEKKLISSRSIRDEALKIYALSEAAVAYPGIDFSNAKCSLTNRSNEEITIKINFVMKTCLQFITINFETKSQ